MSASLTVSLAVVPQNTPAQSNAEGGVRTSLALSSTVQSRNGNAEAITGASLTTSSETRNQRIVLTLGANTYLGRDGVDDLSIEDPFATLSYTRSNKNSRVSMDLSFGQTLLDDSTQDLSDITDIEDVRLQQQGSRETRSIALAAEFGLASPVNTQLEYNLVEQSFTDTTDPDLNDTTSERIALTTQLRFSPVVTGVFLASQDRFDDDQTTGTVRDIDTRFGAGVRLQLSPNQRASLNVFHQTFETTAPSGTTEDDGLSWDADFENELANGGFAALRLSSLFTDGGRTRRAEFERQWALKTTQLNLGIGVTDFDTASVGEVGAIGSLGLEKTLSTGTLAASYGRSATVDDNGDLNIIDRIEMSYTHALTRTSTLSASAQYIDLDDRSAGNIDGTRVGLEVTYSKNVTKDWDLSSGIRLSRSQETGQSSTTDNTLFVTLRRNFNWKH